MADSTNHFTSAIEAMFQGVDQLVTTKTVVGDAVRVDDAIILPLMDVTCGMAAGAILVIQNGCTRLVNIKNQNTVNKVLDMVPDIVNKFTSGKVSVGEEFSQDAVKTAEKMAKEQK